MPRRLEPRGRARVHLDAATTYLSYPLAFRAAHKVPMYVDQFGAPTNAAGQLDYERDLVSFCESQDLHWTRWSFDAGGQASRKIVGNDGVRDFYRDLIAGLRRDQ
jgi:hypothetical protein